MVIFVEGLLRTLMCSGSSRSLGVCNPADSFDNDRLQEFADGGEEGYGPIGLHRGTVPMHGLCTLGPDGG